MEILSQFVFSTLQGDFKKELEKLKKFTSWHVLTIIVYSADGKYYNDESGVPV